MSLYNLQTYYMTIFIFMCYYYPTSHHSCFFFFNDTATTEIYTLSLHDALPIWRWWAWRPGERDSTRAATARVERSEEHTSELQSRRDLVCRLLLEKKKKKKKA